MISALASRERSSQKNKGMCYFILTLALLFWFEFFLEATAEAEIITIFFVNLQTTNGHFEINWPLEIYKVWKYEENSCGVRSHF